MARRSRRESATGIYHIMIRGINGEEVFKQKKDIRRMYHILKKYMTDEMEMYAYCIMPNHLHLLVRGNIEELSVYMKKVELTYALYYNFERERSGYVFQGRFKSECVEDERYFWTCLRYIHNNPVKARLAKRGEPYIGCSTWEYENGKAYLLHKKAFEICGKNVDLYEGEDENGMKIVMDIKGEEEKQRNEYLQYKMEAYAEERKLSSEALLESNTLIKEFVEYAVKDKVVTKAFIERSLNEMKSLSRQKCCV